MRRLFEQLVSSLPLDPRSRRVLDETLNDWKHEEGSIDAALRRWLSDLRSAWSVARALVLVSVWRPNAAIAQSANGAPLSARDEIIDVVNRLSPDSSYEDILREIARAKAAKGEPGIAPPPAPRFGGPFWKRAARVAAVCVCIALIGATIQTYATKPVYRATTIVRAEPDVPPVPASAQAQQMLQPMDPEAFMTMELMALTSRSLALRVVRVLRLAEPAPGANTVDDVVIGPESPAESRAVEDLSRRLIVSPDPRAYLFMISYADASPDKAARVANAFAEQYVARNFERKRKAISDRVDAINKMVADTNVQLEGDRSLLLSRTGALSLVDPAVMAANVAEAQKEATARQHDADAKRITAQELRKFDLETEKGLESALSHPEIYRNVAFLRQEITQARNNVTAMNARGFGPENTRTMEARGQLQKAQADLKTEVQRIVDAAQKASQTAAAQLENAKRALEYQQRLAFDNQRNAIPHSGIRERITANEHTLQQLREQKTQFELLAAGVSNNFQIAETATTLLRRPDTVMIFWAWIAGGLVVAAIAAFVRGRRAFPGPKGPGLQPSVTY
jgi:succinoglycan biosynthesis transport protein ExoP